MTTTKTDATRVAYAALAGFELRKLADGRWLISKWNLHREIATDAELDEFLQRVGAAS
ncbi:MAG: hypothetical protein Q8M01_19615 [Rubrivivax sp.]|nr:hypothetical protein [Rubrivivax sp.]